MFPFGFFFLKLKLYFPQETLVADIILPVLFFTFFFFLIKYLNFYFNVQEKPPNVEPL